MNFSQEELPEILFELTEILKDENELNSFKQLAELIGISSFQLYQVRSTKSKASESSVRKVIRNCVIKANISKRATTHTLRHCFATHLMDSGVGIRYIQELLGHKDIKTTLIYTHVTNLEISKIQSPLDNLMMGKCDDIKILRKWEVL